jgi:hypothetical protein
VFGVRLSLAFAGLRWPACVFVGMWLACAGIRWRSLAIVGLHWPFLDMCWLVVGQQWPAWVFVDMWLACVGVRWPSLAIDGPSLVALAIPGHATLACRWPEVVFVGLRGSSLACGWPALAFAGVRWLSLAIVGHRWPAAVVVGHRWISSAVVVGCGWPLLACVAACACVGRSRSNINRKRIIKEIKTYRRPNDVSRRLGPS